MNNQNSLELKQGTLIYQVNELLEQGKNIDEIIKALNSNYNAVYKAIWHINKKRDGNNSNATPQVGKHTSLPSSTAKPMKVATIKEKMSITPINPCMEKYIPMESEKYISRKFAGVQDIKILENEFRATHKENILLIGETGTGKTHCVRSFCAKNKLPYARINLNGGTTADELLGRWVPKSDGGFKWQDGILTEFVRYGGVIVLDEVNVCPAEILAALHSVTDRERAIHLTDKDGELIKAHPQFFIVATMNPSGDYEGTKPLNWAFKDRFEIKLPFDYDNKIEDELITNKKFLKFARLLRTKRGTEIMSPISTRALLAYCKHESVYGAKLAFEMFLNNFDESEKKAIADVWEMLKHESVAQLNTGEVKQNGTI